MTFDEIASFTDPVGVATQAREILARMKAKGITTILYSGDPLAPKALTTEATGQDYFPEWVITGSALVDSTIFSRTYDQKQWAHAFGMSNLSARVSPEVEGPAYAYEWFNGTPAPAKQAAALAAQPLGDLQRDPVRRPEPHPRFLPAGHLQLPGRGGHGPVARRCRGAIVGSSTSRTMPGSMTAPRSGGTPTPRASTRSTRKGPACGPTSTAASGTSRGNGPKASRSCSTRRRTRSPSTPSCPRERPARVRTAAVRHLTPRPDRMAWPDGCRGLDR